MVVPDNSSARASFEPHDPPLYSSPIDVMAVSQSSQLNRLSAKLVSSSAICFKCGKPGHILLTCTSEDKPPRRCFACSGINHFSQNSPSRSRQLLAQPSKSMPKLSIAVSSAGTGAPQLFSEAVIVGVLIRDELVDTGTAFSMASSALHDRLPSRLSINSFKNSAPDMVKVCGANVEVRGYIDVPLTIAGIEMAHPLKVVTNLSFPFLIRMDVLQPHAAKMLLKSVSPLELSARVCDVCLEQRTISNPSYRSAPAVACVAESTIVAPKSASLVIV